MIKINTITLVVSVEVLFGGCLNAQAVFPQALASPPPNVAALSSEMSTTMLITTRSGQYSQEQTGHYYRDKDGKTRVDLAVASIITDPLSRTVTYIDNAKRQAKVMHMPPIPANPIAKRDSIPAPAATQPVADFGTTTFEGHPVSKKIATFNVDKSTSSRAEMLQSQETWVATDIQLPVMTKTVGLDRVTTQKFYNIKIGDVNEATFKLPDGYQVVEDKTQPIRPFQEIPVTEAVHK